MVKDTSRRGPVGHREARRWVPRRVPRDTDRTSGDGRWKQTNFAWWDILGHFGTVPVSAAGNIFFFLFQTVPFCSTAGPAGRATSFFGVGKRCILSKGRATAPRVGDAGQLLLFLVSNRLIPVHRSSGGLGSTPLDGRTPAPSARGGRTPVSAHPSAPAVTYCRHLRNASSKRRISRKRWAG
jgi:hypothetical protein